MYVSCNLGTLIWGKEGGGGHGGREQGILGAKNPKKGSPNKTRDV